MFIEERHDQIVNIIKSKGRISISEIQEQFKISKDSARRDLRILEKNNRIKRTHGGAIPIRQIGFTPILNFTHQTVDTIYENYWAIARHAVTFIKEHDVIYLSAGTIGYYMAKNLPSNISFTVICNNISIAEELRPKENIRTIITGGELNARGSIKDGLASAFIKNVRIDKSFITSAAISADFGASIQSSENVEFIRTLLNSSKESIGLYPTEKIGFESILKICDASNFSTIITDWNANKTELTKFSDMNLDVIVVDKGEVA